MRREVIGDAVLYLGDAREVVAEIDRVDFIFTDPPYGHNNNDGDLIEHWEKALGRMDYRRGRQAKGRPIANDGVAEAGDLVRWLFAEAARVLPPGGCCCCCCGGGGGPDPQFARWSLWMDEVLDFKQMVVWDKGKIGMGWHYRRSYETVLVGTKPGAACRWFDETSKIENIIRHIPKIIPSAGQHPTIKPVALSAHFIGLHTVSGNTVLDPFMGSGTTGVAAVREGRKFIGVELDERWFDEACRCVERETRAAPLLREKPRHPTMNRLF